MTTRPSSRKTYPAEVLTPAEVQTLRRGTAGHRPLPRALAGTHAIPLHLLRPYDLRQTRRGCHHHRPQAKPGPSPAGRPAPLTIPQLQAPRSRA